jgi:hypothetical protein
MRALALLAVGGCYYNTLAIHPQGLASRPEVRISTQQIQIEQYKRIVRPETVVKVTFPEGVREMPINELLARCSPERFQIDKPPDGFPDCDLVRAQYIYFGRQREVNTELILASSLVGSGIGLLACADLCGDPYDKISLGSFVTLSIGFISLAAFDALFGLDVLDWFRNK